MRMVAGPKSVSFINETTRLALDDDIQVEDQGIVPIRGKIQEVRVFSVPVINNQ